MEEEECEIVYVKLCGTEKKCKDDSQHCEIIPISSPSLIPNDFYINMYSSHDESDLSESSESDTIVDSDDTDDNESTEKV